LFKKLDEEDVLARENIELARVFKAINVAESSIGATIRSAKDNRRVNSWGIVSWGIVATLLQASGETAEKRILPKVEVESGEWGDASVSRFCRMADITRLTSATTSLMQFAMQQRDTEEPGQKFSAICLERLIKAAVWKSIATTRGREWAPWTGSSCKYSAKQTMRSWLLVGVALV
jgi:hypothetical protein